MTLAELARLAEVSPATVSRVFSRHPNIREDVRTRVLALARKHGYHPRISDKQKNIVIITPYHSVFPVHSCVDMLLMALTQTLPARGFRLEILPLNDLDRLDSIRFCAAAAIGVEEADFPQWADRFIAPLVIVDRELKTRSENIFSVHSDEPGGMELAIGHLAVRNCHKIGCIIHGLPGTGNADARRNGIVEALRKHGLPDDESLICFSGPGSEKYVELIGKLLHQGVDALFCPGGNAGIVAQYALSLFNKRVPEDISLIASEQTAFSQYAVPPQTAITQDYPAVAAAVSALIEQWLDNGRPTPSVVLPYQLLIRESVRTR